MKASDAKKTLQKQYKRQNEFIKKSYDRVALTLPKGTKERITATGESINGFIARLVISELDKIEQSKTEK